MALNSSTSLTKGTYLPLNLSAIQEQLTSAIHNAVDKITEGNKGVIVTIVGTHNCVSCRGVKH